MVEWGLGYVLKLKGDKKKMSTIETKTANAIRVLSADAIQKAKSGHPGLPLGCASAAYELWANHMRHNPADPKWEDRDRFILSGGHGSIHYSIYLDTETYPWKI